MPWPIIALLIVAFWLVACGVCLALVDAFGDIRRADESLDDPLMLYHLDGRPYMNALDYLDSRTDSGGLTYRNVPRRVRR